MSEQTQLIQEFRKVTGLGLLEARNFLKEANWNYDAAIESVHKKLGTIVDGRAHRETRSGVVESYIHVGEQIGVLLEVNCETDFVARNENFRKFVKNICLQIAATNPQYISRDEIPYNVVEEEKRNATERAPSTITSDTARARFVGGMMDRFYGTVCLLDQTYVKQSDKTVKDILNELIAQTKENIRIRRFTRYHIGH